MKKGVFISYSEVDRNKKESIKKVLEKSKCLLPIIIAERRQSMKNLSDKIIKGINEADYLIPILTKNSINNQWVNQEIGFAKSQELERKIRIIPIIESSLLSEKLLKGFIHDQLDLPYNFKSDTNQSKERRNFRKCYNLLIADLELEIMNNKLVKFKSSKKLYLRKDSELYLFPDFETRALFGLKNEDIYEYNNSEITNFKIAETIPSIKNVKYIEYDNKIYAQFGNELKHIPNPDTYKYICQFNKNTPIKIMDLHKGMFIGMPLIDKNNIEK